MGSPDLPNEENNICRPPESSLPMHGGNTTASDDSDIENIEYLGYEPLAFDEDTMEYTSQQNNHDNDEDDANDNFDYQAFNYPTEAPETGIVISSVDSEVESEVWSAPRPDSTNIILDSTRTEQIMTAMNNFTIPNACIPSWAQGVSEEKWKEDLLQKIRERQNANSNK